MIIVAIDGVAPELIAVNDTISPVPLAGRPIEVLLLVQTYVFIPPVLVVPKISVAVGLPLQTS
jgi:hypothetical protein